MGKYNNSYYNRGYAEGLANSKNGAVTYITHSHADTCKKTCNAYYTRSLANNLGNGKYTAYVYEHHPNCGAGTKSYYWTVQGSEFDNQPCTHIYYTCGYSEGQIIGAEITFE